MSKNINELMLLKPNKVPHRHIPNINKNRISDTSRIIRSI